MKTSFYFVLWIIIFPFLDLFNNDIIAEHSFLVAIAIVWILTWLLNQLMPKTLTYERASQEAPILENLYTGNVSAFIKRLRAETYVETVTAIYLLVTTAVIAYSAFKVGVNDWFALIVFALFAFGAISRSIRLSKALTAVKSNPTPEQCVETADEVYGLDYATYYEDRQTRSYEQMLPERPRHFKLFMIFSTGISVICSLLGVLFILLAVGMMIGSDSLATDALAATYLLYGSLAAYFGIKDFASIVQSLRTKKTSDKQLA